ncbi:MAG: T9SS type A sorting domain-containing protein [Prevotellaceae bacterium]|nr:T9SS type A sorting domain-containing protein [Prevotellaceae bacterium]
MKIKFIFVLLLTCVFNKANATDDITVKGTTVTENFSYPTATQNIPAFPSAVGFGKYTTGGRGGHVVTVTNLDDDADNPSEGSLRWALQQYPGEPLTIVFNVSGWIILKDQLKISHKGGLTIAGQTAPGEGITLYPHGISFNSAGDENVNVIMRNIRVRCGSRGWDGQLLDIENPEQVLGTENAYNIIIDHCTFGWSGEELCTNSASFFQTYSYNIFHEGLYNAGHKKGNRGYGVCWGGGASTFSHNLLINNCTRSPRFAASVNYDYLTYYEFVNNVNYNWGNYNACYGGDNKSTSTRFNGYLANIMNNYWKPGPATIKNVADSKLLLFSQGGGSSPSYFYVTGNTMERRSDITADNSVGVTTDSYGSLVSNILVPTKFFTANWSFDVNAYTMLNNLQTADEAFQSVIEKSGCIVRDSIERRLIRECKDGTATFGGSWKSDGNYGIIDDPVDAEMSYNNDSTTYCRVAEASLSRADGWDSDGDGMPDEWETANGFDPNNAEDGNYINAEGYTALEKYLCELMGETIDGTFGDATDIRTLHAVKFNVSVNGSTLNITSEANITKLHIFDALGRCMLTSSLGSGNNSINIGALPKGVYIVWVTDSNGYRNAIKINI